MTPTAPPLRSQAARLPTQHFKGAVPMDSPAAPEFRTSALGPRPRRRRPLAHQPTASRSSSAASSTRRWRNNPQPTHQPATILPARDRNKAQQRKPPAGRHGTSRRRRPFRAAARWRYLSEGSHLPATSGFAPPGGADRSGGRSDGVVDRAAGGAGHVGVSDIHGQSTGATQVAF